MASAKSSSTDSSPKLSSSSSTIPSSPLIISALSYGRVFLGSALLLAPNLLCNLLSIPLSPYTSTFIRLVGARDAVMGEHLWFAQRSFSSPAAAAAAAAAAHVDTKVQEAKRAEVRRDVMAQMAVDGVESLLLAALYARGSLSGVGGARLALLGGVGSAAFVGLGGIALKSL